VSPGFFANGGLHLFSRRELSRESDDAQSRPVIVINESLARFEFGATNVVGRRVGVLADSGAPREIIGVVRARSTTPPGQGMGMFYLSYRQRPRSPRMRHWSSTPIW